MIRIFPDDSGHIKLPETHEKKRFAFLVYKKRGDTVAATLKRKEKKEFIINIKGKNHKLNFVTFALVDSKLKNFMAPFLQLVSNKVLNQNHQNDVNLGVNKKLSDSGKSPALSLTFTNSSDQSNKKSGSQKNFNQPHTPKTPENSGTPRTPSSVHSNSNRKGGRSSRNSNSSKQFSLEDDNNSIFKTPKSEEDLPLPPDFEDHHSTSPLPDKKIKNKKFLPEYHRRIFAIKEYKNSSTYRQILDLEKTLKKYLEFSHINRPTEIKIDDDKISRSDWDKKAKIWKDHMERYKVQLNNLKKSTADKNFSEEDYNAARMLQNLRQSSSHRNKIRPKKERRSRSQSSDSSSSSSSTSSESSSNADEFDNMESASQVRYNPEHAGHNAPDFDFEAASVAGETMAASSVMPTYNKVNFDAFTKGRAEQEARNQLVHKVVKKEQKTRLNLMEKQDIMKFQKQTSLEQTRLETNESIDSALLQLDQIMSSNKMEAEKSKNQPITFDDALALPKKAKKSRSDRKYENIDRLDFHLGNEMEGMSSNSEFSEEEEIQKISSISNVQHPPAKTKTPEKRISPMTAPPPMPPAIKPPPLPPAGLGGGKSGMTLPPMPPSIGLVPKLDINKTRFLLANANKPILPTYEVDGDSQDDEKDEEEDETPDNVVILESPPASPERNSKNTSKDEMSDDEAKVIELPPESPPQEIQKYLVENEDGEVPDEIFQTEEQILQKEKQKWLEIEEKQKVDRQKQEEELRQMEIENKEKRRLAEIEAKQRKEEERKRKLEDLEEGEVLSESESSEKEDEDDPMEDEVEEISQPSQKISESKTSEIWETSKSPKNPPKMANTFTEVGKILRPKLVSDDSDWSDSNGNSSEIAENTKLASSETDSSDDGDYLNEKLMPKTFKILSKKQTGWKTTNTKAFIPIKKTIIKAVKKRDDETKNEEVDTSRDMVKKEDKSELDKPPTKPIKPNMPKSMRKKAKKDEFTEVISTIGTEIGGPINFIDSKISIKLDTGNEIPMEDSVNAYINQQSDFVEQRKLLEDGKVKLAVTKKTSNVEISTANFPIGPFLIQNSRKSLNLLPANIRFWEG